MAKFSEDTLSNWTNPPSDSEETKLSNAERMVKEAINSDAKLKSKSIEIFGQGSYANNTNIRLNSDIDINVHYTDAFYFHLPDELKREDVGLNNSVSYSFSEYKSDVENALVAKFGKSDVKRKNKCINVVGNTYRVQVDIVPTWKHQWYYPQKTFNEGVVLFADSSPYTQIVNYPKQHIANGKTKNNNTLRRFKSLVRIFKMAKVKMEDDKYFTNNNITSFLLECLVWNVPNSIFTDYSTWNERTKQAIIFLYNNTNDDSQCKDWGEVSNLLYLFHSGRKWTREEVNTYLVRMWNYMEYN